MCGTKGFCFVFKVARNYSGPLNFRFAEPNPVAVVVWRQNKGQIDRLQEDAVPHGEPIHLQNFILDNSLQQSNHRTSLSQSYASLITSASL